VRNSTHLNLVGISHVKGQLHGMLLTWRHARGHAEGRMEYDERMCVILLVVPKLSQEEMALVDVQCYVPSSQP
jgi:hypothetical protein